MKHTERFLFELDLEILKVLRVIKIRWNCVFNNVVYLFFSHRDILMEEARGYVGLDQLKSKCVAPPALWWEHSKATANGCPW